MSLFLLLFIPIVLAVGAFLLSKGKIDVRELAVQLGVTLLIVLVPYGIALYSMIVTAIPDQRYMEAVREAWIGGKINDTVVVVGEEIAYVTEDHEVPTFVNVERYPDGSPMVKHWPDFQPTRVLLRPRDTAGFLGGLFWIDSIKERAPTPSWSCPASSASARTA